MDHFAQPTMTFTNRILHGAFTLVDVLIYMRSYLWFMSSCKQPFSQILLKHCSGENWILILSTALVKVKMHLERLHSSAMIKCDKNK